MTHFTLRSNFLKNCSVTFFLIAHMEGPSWPLSPVKTPFWLNRPKLVKMVENRSKMTYFALRAKYLRNRLIKFLQIWRNDHMGEYNQTFFSRFSLFSFSTDLWPFLGQKWPFLGQKWLWCNFLKNCLITFFLITHMESPSWPLS